MVIYFIYSFTIYRALILILTCEPFCVSILQNKTRKESETQETNLVKVKEKVKCTSLLNYNQLISTYLSVLQGRDEKRSKHTMASGKLQFVLSFILFLYFCWEGCSFYGVEFVVF